APCPCFALFPLCCSRRPPVLHSFPTRRSSDLAFVENIQYFAGAGGELGLTFFVRGLASPFGHLIYTSCIGVALGLASRSKNKYRSEEHTSELQSRFDLVCRLLLEKKNKKQYL